MFIKELSSCRDSKGYIRRYCLYKCDYCDKEYSTRLDSNQKSCGCLLKEWNKGGYKHGLTYHYLYSTWLGIKNRCYNKNKDNYKDYGERGIKMYEEWYNSVEKFIEWIEQNLGRRPKRHTLDRINNNGNYEPGNLKWSTQPEQYLNSRKFKPLI